MPRQLKGGHAGYRRAVAEALRANMSNPCVVYSDRQGFTVQSGLLPLDDDEAMVLAASYCGQTGMPSGSGSRSEYTEVRVWLVAWLDAMEKTCSRRAAQIAAAEARFRWANRHG